MKQSTQEQEYSYIEKRGLTAFREYYVKVEDRNLTFS